MSRAPTVRYDNAPPGAPDVGVRPARRGEAHRTVRVHWHADGHHPGTDAVLRVYRDARGAPVVVVDALVACGRVVVNPTAADAAAREIDVARTARQAVEVTGARAEPDPIPVPLADRDFWAIWADDAKTR